MSAEPGPDWRMRLNTMRIILFALAMGVVSFLIVAVFLRAGGGFQGQAAGEPLLTYLALLFALVMLPLSFVIPSLMVKGARRELAAKAPSSANDDTTWWGLYQTRLIIGAAILEGSAFFLLIAYLIEGSPWTLAVAGVFALGILCKLPTQERVERWVAEQRDRAER